MQKGLIESVLKVLGTPINLQIRGSARMCAFCFTAFQDFITKSS